MWSCDVVVSHSVEGARVVREQSGPSGQHQSKRARGGMTAEKDLFEVDDLQPGRSFLNFSGAGPAKGGLEGIKPFAKDRPRSPPAHGTAKVTYPNGDIYEGSYEGGLRHGKGIIKFADGRQYRGKWRLDMPHGQGEEIRADRTLSLIHI